MIRVESLDGRPRLANVVGTGIGGASCVLPQREAYVSVAVVA
jgi:hypothetical protein